MIPRIGLFVLAALLLGAHYLRAGNILLVVVCVAAPLLFCVKKRWTLIVLQVLAYGAALVWVDALIRLVGLREQNGQPWTAAAIILGGVAVLTVVAGLLLNSRSIAHRYSA